MISSGSCVSKTIGIASTFPKCLNKIAFHSITGNDASHPIFHSHKTAVQSLITAIVLLVRVYVGARDGSLWIARQGAATQGE